MSSIIYKSSNVLFLMFTSNQTLSPSISNDSKMPTKSNTIRVF